MYDFVLRNDSSWTWVFEQFKYTFRERENMCITSDYNERIMKVVNIMYLNILHLSWIWYLWKMYSQTSKKENTDIEKFSMQCQCHKKRRF